jgi:hypothetical protein
VRRAARRASRAWLVRMPTSHGNSPRPATAPAPCGRRPARAAADPAAGGTSRTAGLRERATRRPIIPGPAACDTRSEIVPALAPETRRPRARRLASAPQPATIPAAPRRSSRAGGTTCSGRPCSKS